MQDNVVETYNRKKVHWIWYFNNNTDMEAIIELDDK